MFENEGGVLDVDLERLMELSLMQPDEGVLARVLRNLVDSDDEGHVAGFSNFI